MLAKEGFTGATAILEGQKGFCQAIAPEFNLAPITDSLGKPPYRIEGNSFKIHSSCRHTHPSIDIVLDLSARHHISPAQVADMVVRTGWPWTLPATPNRKRSTRRSSACLSAWRPFHFQPWIGKDQRTFVAPKDKSEITILAVKRTAIGEDEPIKLIAHQSRGPVKTPDKAGFPRSGDHHLILSIISPGDACFSPSRLDHSFQGRGCSRTAFSRRGRCRRPALTGTPATIFKRQL